MKNLGLTGKSPGYRNDVEIPEDLALFLKAKHWFKAYRNLCRKRCCCYCYTIIPEGQQNVEVPHGTVTFLK